MMSRPRENPKKKNLKNFPPTQFLKKSFQAFFLTNASPINTLEALLGDFGDFDFVPETGFSTLTEMINIQVF